MVYDAIAPASERSPRWDLFCTVVDNHGDAGVAWRLARELVHEHGRAVTLWIDAPRALAGIAALDPARPEQRIDGVDVRATHAWTAQCGAADVVVELFESGLPDGYVALMQQRVPHWFVLEYLSAEGWIDDRHALPSPHPATGLPRRFWFPGFTQRTAGLLRERSLFARRDAFLANRDAQAGLWRTLGLAAAPQGTRVSLFCYPHAPVAALLDAWSGGSERTTCLVPEGVAIHGLREWTSGRTPGAGSTLVRGALTLHAVPFVLQERYDELLWSCDINFVRGEDSFVRAQWAARPLVWQAYAQREDAHRVKLAAFVDRYTTGLGADAAHAYRAFSHAWNMRADTADIAQRWRALLAHHEALAGHARSWAAQLATLPELAQTLVQATRFRV